MTAERAQRLFWQVGVLIVLSWFSLAIVDPDPPGSNVVRLGYFLGSLFAQTTLAAAWSALGPGLVRGRVVLSLMWVAILIVAVSINVSIHGGPNDVWLTLGAALFSQWVFLQLPLLGLVFMIGLSLCHVDDLASTSDASRISFGIRHLFVIMSVIGVVLGVSRVIIPWLVADRNEFVIFLFLAAATILTALPILLGSLIRGNAAIRGVLLALMLMGTATAWEGSILAKAQAFGPRMEDFIAINVASAIVILLFAGVVRVNGYVLVSRTWRAAQAELNAVDGRSSRAG